MNSINNNNDIGLIEFFKYLNQVTNMFITAIEVKPIRIKKDMYITGFKRNGLNIIEAHVKHIKQLYTKINQNTTEIILKETPETEIWMDVELLEPSIIRIAFNDLRNYFFQLKGFEIVHIEYKLKTDKDNLCTQEETIIYDNKKIACKEIIKKRKLCSMFKSHFIQWGENKIPIKQNSPQYTTLTDEEIAEMK